MYFVDLCSLVVCCEEEEEDGDQPDHVDIDEYEVVGVVLGRHESPLA